MLKFFTTAFLKKTCKRSLPIFLKLRFTPRKAEQLLRGMELQEKEAQKDYRTQEICLERTYS